MSSLGRNYLTVLAANAVSRAGDALDAVAYSWMAYQLTGSAATLGALLAVNALPNLLFAPLAGVWVDRHRKQPVVVLCHLGRGGIVGLTALLFLLGRLDVALLFVLTFVNSAFETFATPASGALTVHLVDRNRLVEAGGLSSSVLTLAQMLGLGLSGVVLAGWGAGGALLIDALTFFVAAGLTSVPRIEGDRAFGGALTPGVWWADLREGLSFLVGSRTLLVVATLALFANFAFAPLNVLEAPYVKEVLRAPAQVLSWLSLGLAVGMVVGGLVVSRIERRWGTWPTVLGAFGGLGLAVVLVGLAGLLPPGSLAVPAAIGAYALAGLFLPLATTPLGAWLSARVPPEKQGRVFSALNALGLAALPLGSAAAGSLAGVVDIPVILASTGVLVIVAVAGARWALGPAVDDGEGS